MLPDTAPNRQRLGPPPASFSLVSLPLKVMADRIPTLPGAPLNVIESKIDPTSARFEKNMRAMAELVSTMRNQEEEIALGGGEKAIESQHRKGRLTARERIKLLVDPGTEFSELGVYAAYKMYEE